MPKRISDRFFLLQAPPRKGGQSEVRKAFDRTSTEGGFAAIKLLRPHDEKLLPSDGGEAIRIFMERETDALKALHHPNIVRMLDSGWDEEQQRYYVALEWVDRSLRDEVRDGQPMAWPVFLERVGKPLASALAYAHAREVEHRDVKPGNILMDRETLKLADFGISKMRSKVEDSENTVAKYRSSLYAPPEWEDAIPFVRDVFSYGVLAVQILTGKSVQDYPGLAPTVDQLDIAPEFRAIFRDCVSLEPNKRPANAIVLEQRLLEADRVCGDRDSRRRNALWLGLTISAAKKILGDVADDEIDWPRARSAIMTDLGGQVHADFGFNGKTKELYRDTVCVAGNSFFMRLKRDGKSLNRVRIVQVDTNRDQDWLDRWREHALSVGAILTPTFDNPGEDAAFEGLTSLEERLEEHEAHRRESRQARAAESLGDLFEGWRRLLDAREEVAAGGRQPLDYQEVTEQGRTIVFRLSQAPETSLVGEEWSVAAYPQGRPVDRGEVTEQEDERISLRFARRGVRIPPRGALVPYLGPSQTALNRQRDALSSVAAGQSVNPLLRDVINDPSCVHARSPIDITQWSRVNLDGSKRDVVRHALGTQDLVLVEGPPGTGKTTVIAEIVVQTLRRTPTARILIVSQTHIAIDNALHGIEKAGVQGLVRLARPDDSRVADNVQHLHIDKQLKRWAKGVRSRAEEYLDALARSLGMEGRHVKAAVLLEEASVVAGDLAHVEEHLTSLRQQRSSEHTTSSRELGDQIVDAQHRRDTLLERRHELYLQVQHVLVGDLSLPPEEDLTAAEAQAAVGALLGGEEEGRKMMNLLRLQGEWLQRIETDQNLVTAFLRTCQVVGGTAIGFLGNPAARDLDFDLCIFDEASKATATEALVPLSRARQWILVGDTRQLPPIDEDILRDDQLMADHQLNEDLVRTTLFEHLARRTEFPVSHLLREQYRMAPAIGNLISSCFYNGELRSPEQRFLHGYEQIGKPVLWLDTVKLGPQRRETDRTATETSISNRSEARLARLRLEVIEQAIARRVIRPPDEGHKLEVLVIAPYGRQVEELRRRLTDLKPAHLTYEVLSVDAVQGRECDLAIFSVTRSNDQSQFGFLGKPYWRRINVALSRARFGLTVIGDAPFCGSARGALRDVLDYMRDHREECEIRDAYL